MRRFQLIRVVDVSGVSGTGLIAEGVLFADGSAAVRWLGKHACTQVWPSLEAAIAVHGHEGNTKFVFMDSVED